MYEELRNRMVDEQIIARGIKDKNVIAAMRKIERHLFAPEELLNRAYDDCPLPIGEEQTISQPYIVALMTECLKLDRTKRVLEIGTGSGYQTAALGMIAWEVYSVERIHSLSKRAQSIVWNMGYGNVSFRVGNGFKGWKVKAPFDAIIVTCAPKEVPKILLDQLTEGGKMIIPVGSRIGDQKLILITRYKNSWREKEITRVRFVPMLDKDPNEA